MELADFSKNYSYFSFSKCAQNISHNSSYSTKSHLTTPQYLYIWIMVVNIIIFITGCVGNVLVICSGWNRPGHENSDKLLPGELGGGGPSCACDLPNVGPYWSSTVRIDGFWAMQCVSSLLRWTYLWIICDRRRITVAQHRMFYIDYSYNFIMLDVEIYSNQCECLLLPTYINRKL